MKSFSWPVWLVCVVLATTACVHYVSAGGCEGSPINLTVDYSAQKIYSPGYPTPYDNNLKCDWVFQAPTQRKAGFAMQFALIEVDMDACDDYIEVFEGTLSNLGVSLGKLCSLGQTIKTNASQVTLRFNTDSHYVGKGFVLEYAYIKTASARCSEGAVTALYAGRTALYEEFSVTSSYSCTWRLEAVDTDGNADMTSVLVLEPITAAFVCAYGAHFKIFDGPDTFSPFVVELCGEGEVFSKVYLSSRQVTLTFSHSGLADILLTLKMYTLSATYNCTSSQIPTIHVDGAPVYLTFPVYKDASGAPCPVHVSQGIQDNIVRLDVISLSGGNTTCDTDVISVKADDQSDVARGCFRKRYPSYSQTYAPQADGLTVRSQSPTAGKVYLRAISSVPSCLGLPEGFIAVDTEAVTKPMLKLKEFVVPHNCLAKALISTDQAVVLSLSWEALDPILYYAPKEADGNPGNLINVYDGPSEDSPLLYSGSPSVRKMIYSTQKDMLVVMSTGAYGDLQIPQLKYYAVPADFVAKGWCRDEYVIEVNRTGVELTSPYYPRNYPFNLHCQYDLKTKFDDVIVITRMDDEYPLENQEGCGDIIKISGSNSGHMCTAEYGKTVVTSGAYATIVFESDDVFSDEHAWKLKITSRDASRGSRDGAGFWLLVFIIFLGNLVMGF